MYFILFYILHVHLVLNRCEKLGASWEDALHPYMRKTNKE